jgi:hypothetical protein
MRGAADTRRRRPDDVEKPCDFRVAPAFPPCFRAVIDRLPHAPEKGDGIRYGFALTEDAEQLPDDVVQLHSEHEERADISPLFGDERGESNPRGASSGGCPRLCASTRLRPRAGVNGMILVHGPAFALGKAMAGKMTASGLNGSNQH